MPSLASAQLLSGIIFLSCTTYLIVSNFYSFSFHNILSELHFQFQQSYTQKLIKDAKEVPVNSFDNLNTTSFICDYVKKQNTHNTNDTSVFEKHLENELRPYCDIVPTPRNRWVSAIRYVESDIVFIIYTGYTFYQTRATAVRDTWLSRVTHKYFFSSTPYSPLPITVIEGAGENYVSNMKKIYKGMKLAYEKHNQTAKFYYLAGCDTFVNVPHILKRLDYFDYKAAHIIGGHPFGHPCFKNKNQIFPGISYPSGGAGFFITARMMEMLYPKIEPYFQNDWPIEKSPYSDVAISCLAKSLGVDATFLPGFWAFTPEKTIKDHGRTEFHTDPEPNTFHYVQPKSMYILDEFYVFQYIDRLANDKNLNELIEFTRKFVVAHYQLLRIKQNECTLPTIKPVKR